MERITLNYSTPIKEFNEEENNDFLIRGTAINATTTKNGHVFLSEELGKSAHTLRNKPILKDHNNSVESIVGKTTDNVLFSTTENKVLFEGKIMDTKMKEMITQGLINSVSIGASVESVEEEVTEEGDETGNIIVRGISFDELSLVAVPADPNAGFAMAMVEKLDLTNKSKVKKELTKEELIMAEEEKKTLEELREQREALEKEVEELKIVKLTALKEAEEAEPEAEAEPEVEEEAPAETKGEVEKEVEKEPEAEEAYKIEKSGLKGQALSADYSKLARCKRLIK